MFKHPFKQHCETSRRIVGSSVNILFVRRLHRVPQCGRGGPPPPGQCGVLGEPGQRGGAGPPRPARGVSQVGWGWPTAGHVTTVLISDWSQHPRRQVGGQQVDPGGGAALGPALPPRHVTAVQCIVCIYFIAKPKSQSRVPSLSQTEPELLSD